jgi:hypothetical protein
MSVIFFVCRQRNIVKFLLTMQTWIFSFPVVIKHSAIKIHGERRYGYIILYLGTNHIDRAFWGMNCLRALGSWVRILLKAWMSVVINSMFVLLCIGRDLATVWSPVQGVLPTLYRIKKLKTCQGPTEDCRAIIIIIVYLSTRWRWEVSFTPRPL